jgi:hypothetical protein
MGWRETLGKMMSFSCSDFTDGVLELMEEHGFVRADDLPGDNPERQYQVVVAALARLACLRGAALELAKALKDSGAARGVLAEKVDQVMALADRIAPPYLVCERYEHIFSGKKATVTRWVMDLKSGEMVVSQQFRSGWKNLSDEDVEDLMEDVRDANAVRENPEDFGAHAVDALPQW